VSTAPERPDPSRRDRRTCALLVVVLTITTGAVDAACFVILGHAFASVITGNLVLLGVSAGPGSATLAAHGGVAVAGYAAGVLAGAPVARERDYPAAPGLAARAPAADGTVWPRRVTACLGLELIALGGLSAGWWLTGGRPAAGAEYGLLGLAGIAMGLQSAAVRRLGQISTTYLTSTLTEVVVSLAYRQASEGTGRSVSLLVAIVAGAAAGALSARHLPAVTPVLFLLPPLLVIAVALTLTRRTRR
jgi:uncharacterized membrane protein YoaK (UPF0700 family)